MLLQGLARAVQRRGPGGSVHLQEGGGLVVARLDRLGEEVLRLVAGQDRQGLLNALHLLGAVRLPLGPRLRLRHAGCLGRVEEVGVRLERYIYIYIYVYTYIDIYIYIYVYIYIERERERKI